MIHGGKILNHDVFLNTNLSFIANCKKSDGTVIIETNDITEIELKIWTYLVDISTETPTLVINKTNQSNQFIVNNTEKQILFDCVVDALPIGKYQYTISLTKTSWTESKNIYRGTIDKNNRIR